MKNSKAEDVLVLAQKVAALTQVVRFLRAAEKHSGTGIQCHMQLADPQQTRTIINSNMLYDALVATADRLRADLEEDSVDVTDILAQEEEQFNKLYN